MTCWLAWCCWCCGYGCCQHHLDILYFCLVVFPHLTWSCPVGWLNAAVCCCLRLMLVAYIHKVNALHSSLLPDKFLFWFFVVVVATSSLTVIMCTMLLIFVQCFANVTDDLMMLPLHQQQYGGEFIQHVRSKWTNWTKQKVKNEKKKKKRLKTGKCSWRACTA